MHFKPIHHCIQFLQGSFLWVLKTRTLEVLEGFYSYSKLLILDWPHSKYCSNALFGNVQKEEASSARNNLASSLYSCLLQAFWQLSAQGVFKRSWYSDDYILRSIAPSCRILFRVITISDHSEYLTKIHNTIRDNVSKSLYSVLHLCVHWWVHMGWKSYNQIWVSLWQWYWTLILFDGLQRLWLVDGYSISCDGGQQLVDDLHHVYWCVWK